MLFVESDNVSHPACSVLIIGLDEKEVFCFCCRNPSHNTAKAQKDDNVPFPKILKRGAAVSKIQTEVPFPKIQREDQGECGRFKDLKIRCRFQRSEREVRQFLKSLRRVFDKNTTKLAVAVLGH